MQREIANPRVETTSSNKNNHLTEKKGNLHFRRQSTISANTLNAFTAERIEEEKAKTSKS